MSKGPDEFWFAGFLFALATILLLILFGIYKMITYGRFW